MPRFTTRQGPIEIAYGFDRVDNSVFLTVVDSRLAWSSEASDSVNEVATTVGWESGCGAYVSLNTSKTGMGKFVDDSTMATYLARYGVSKEQIFELPLKLPDSDPIRKSFSMASLEENSPSTDARHDGQCSECKASSTHVCGKCHVMPYCSWDCQKKNWAIHKVFCGVKTIPSDLDPKQGVQVILLPSDGSTPSFIRVPKKRYVDDLCIGKLLDKRDTVHWRGDVLICKTGLGRLPKYEDIVMSDVKDAVEFLQDYTKGI